MDIFSNTLIIIILLGFIYLLIKPSTKIQIKPSSQKKEEIIVTYEKKLLKELNSIKDKNKRQIKKTQLLKEYAKELEFNVFFDQEEIKHIIKNLASL